VLRAADNAFLHIADPLAAQRLADSLDAATLHRQLDEWARRFCPVLSHFRTGVHWSFMQVEYATDVVFRQQATFQPLYEAIVRTAVHVIKAERVASFLGHKLSANYQGEVGNDFSARIRHHMGSASLKLYDKAGLIARIACTAHYVAFFKHHRHMEQRNGQRAFKLAPPRKSDCSGPAWSVCSRRMAGQPNPANIPDGVAPPQGKTVLAHHCG
jgi:hypothetical protein